jgi:hypothetical protein
LAHQSNPDFTAEAGRTPRKSNADIIFIEKPFVDSVKLRKSPFMVSFGFAQDKLLAMNG